MNWNDNVSTIYKDIFTPEIIIEVQKSLKELEQDLLFRISYKVAPGYKDSGKADDGIGDLIIWQTIIEIANSKQKDVLFVTNDQKNDWFYRQDNLGLYPRFELYDEFRRKTGGKSIGIVNLLKFLKLSAANEETINEIKTIDEEKETKDNISFEASFTGFSNEPSPTQNNIYQLKLPPPSFATFTIIGKDKSNTDINEVIQIFYNLGIKIIHVNLTNSNIIDIRVKIDSYDLIDTVFNAFKEKKRYFITAQPA